MFKIDGQSFGFVELILALNIIWVVCKKLMLLGGMFLSLVWMEISSFFMKVALYAGELFSHTNFI